MAHGEEWAVLARGRTSCRPSASFLTGAFRTLRPAAGVNAPVYWRRRQRRMISVSTLILSTVCQRNYFLDLLPRSRAPLLHLRGLYDHPVTRAGVATHRGRRPFLLVGVEST